jgi:hypothetical protein
METWLDWATKIPGPPWKGGYFGIGQTRPLSLVEGDVKHSAEGQMTALLAEVMHPTRQASWHFSVGLDRVVQHYPLEWIAWHCGKPGDADTETELVGNVSLVGIEHSGKAGDALTPYQRAATVRITQDIRRLGFAGTYPPELAVNLFEHNWISPVTACPSNRIPWDDILAELTQEEDDMGLEPDERATLLNQSAQVTETLQAIFGGTSPARTVAPKDSIMGRLETLEMQINLMPTLKPSDADLKQLAKYAIDFLWAKIKESQ